jgi:predicted dehydrogenase
MKTTNRRSFIQQSALATAAVTIAGAPSLHAADANRKLVVGIIGPGGMGMNHLRSLITYKDVEVTYVCDADESRANQAAGAVERGLGKRPQVVKDMRRVLEDKTVDAVFIAAPDHWHTPASILAVDAGKHVYVEKPVSHNIREGRLLVEAARRNKRVVQVGTQSRSAEHVKSAMERLHNGAIGDVLIAKAWNSQLRGNIGKAKPSAPPVHLDYDLWIGPAPMVPFQSNLLHSSWRWFLPFGAGDAGNDGVHDIDLARWGLGVNTHPNTIAGLGGKYFFDDDQQFPDTQYVVFEYESGAKKKQLIYEHRIWSPYVQEGHENGNAFYGTKGLMIFGKHNGWQLYGSRNKLIEEVKGKLDLSLHHRNFFDAIRNEKPAATAADAEAGHLSAALAHLANIVTRLGRTLKFDPTKEQFINDSEANKLVSRTYREGHWAVPKGV